MGKLWIYSITPFNSEIIAKLRPPELSSAKNDDLLIMLLLLAQMCQSKRESQSQSDGDETKIVACGRCRQKCAWVPKYQGNYMDCYECDRCKKGLYGPRFCCEIHYYNICYACSIIGTTRKTCGCFGSLKNSAAKGSLCLVCLQPSDEGYNCVKGCDFFMCKKCSTVSLENDFFKRYKFDAKDLLGKGGFGEVYKCRDTVSNEICAVKKIELEKMNPNQKAKTLVEIDIMKQLNHPNIIQFKDSVFTKDEKLYIAMTLADGGDLSKVIDNQKKSHVPFEEKFIVNMMCKICDALKFLHLTKKIIHRDLKPQNILLTKAGLVKLVDFGLAYDFNAHFNHLAVTMLGSPLYISPEILNATEYDYKTDVWSLGCIMNEMACLSYTFYGDSMAQIFEIIKKGVYKEASSKYSPAFRVLIKNMIMVDSTKRFNIEQVVDSLNKIGSKMK